MRVRFANILLSGPCQKIDFWCGGLHVSGFELARVARAIYNCDKRLQTLNIRVGSSGAGTASYQTWTNTIVVPNRNYAASSEITEHLAVVHECVHALRDSHGRTLQFNGRRYNPRGATDEVTAYVASCLFSIYQQQQCGNNAVDKPAWLNNQTFRIHAAAYEVALRQARKPSGTALDRADLSNLFKLYTSDFRAKLRESVPRHFDWDGIALPRASAGRI